MALGPTPPPPPTPSHWAWSSFSGLKRQIHRAEYSPSSSAEVKKYWGGGAIFPPLQLPSWRVQGKTLLYSWRFRTAEWETFMSLAWTWTATLKAEYVSCGLAQFLRFVIVCLWAFRTKAATTSICGQDIAIWLLQSSLSNFEHSINNSMLQCVPWDKSLNINISRWWGISTEFLPVVALNHINLQGVALDVIFLRKDRLIFILCLIQRECII